MTEWSWRIDGGLLLCGARADSFSAWLFFPTRRAKGPLCAVAAGSGGLAGQPLGQRGHPLLLPADPRWAFLCSESVIVCVGVWRLGKEFMTYPALKLYSNRSDVKTHFLGLPLLFCYFFKRFYGV